MKVELQIENVVTKTECYKTFDVDALVKYNGAFRDIGFPPAKFRFMRPKKQVTVNVYKTGKIICLGAKSIERAIEYTKRIMKKLDITDSSEITVTRVMMSGHFVEKVNVYNAIPLIEKASRFIGIDCNTTGHAAVVAIPHTGKIHKLGKSAIHTHSKYKAVRKKLQRQGKFSLLKKIKNKESRIVKNINHHVSKKIVSKNQGIVLENIKGIRKLYRKGNGQGKKYRGRMNSWSYYELQRQIEYKAKWAGLPVRYVRAVGTSSKCAVCGVKLISEEHRKMWCPSCRNVVDRDINAAKNILARGMRFVPDGSQVEAVKQSKDAEQIVVSKSPMILYN